MPIYCSPLGHPACGRLRQPEVPTRSPVIPCALLPETKAKIDAYVEALIQIAPSIGTHGLTAEQFHSSGIFRSAIEQIRGTQSASMAEKRSFMAAALGYLQSSKLIRVWEYQGSGERHDYQVTNPSRRISVIETKG